MKSDSWLTCNTWPGLTTAFQTRTMTFWTWFWKWDNWESSLWSHSSFTAGKCQLWSELFWQLLSVRVSEGQEFSFWWRPVCALSKPISRYSRWIWCAQCETRGQCLYRRPLSSGSYAKLFIGFIRKNWSNPYLNSGSEPIFTTFLTNYIIFKCNENLFIWRLY